MDVSLGVGVVTGVGVGVATGVGVDVTTGVGVGVATGVGVGVATGVGVGVATGAGVGVATGVGVAIAIELHTSPVMVGFSAVLFKLLVPCNPNSTLLPGRIVEFQERLLAVYGLLPLTFAFQPLVRRLSPLYCQPTVQSFIGVLVSLVIRIFATNPLFHSDAIMYSQIPAWAAGVTQLAVTSVAAMSGRNDSYIFFFLKLGVIILIP